MENLKLVELNKSELIKTSGGVGRLKPLINGARWLLEAAGAYDAYHSFMEGWEGCAPE